MARKEDVIIRVLVDSAAEIGIVKGLQAFAAKMAPNIMRIEREGKLNEFQIALALGWMVRLSTATGSTGKSLQRSSWTSCSWSLPMQTLEATGTGGPAKEADAAMVTLAQLAGRLVCSVLAIAVIGLFWFSPSRLALPFGG